MLAGRALNLPAGVLRLAFERLIAVGTVEFEFVGIHRLYLPKRDRRGKRMPKNSSILFADKLRLVW